ncbi:hypothetical protein [Bradyrhizobium vignae]|uniref:hypothetical protein n=1 Tax=Bradyrhizobium vignae TaxID=1549949 RepID=UPI00100BD166|nr:hypothetical protein [Bradyrhizobium vignae]RXH03571.1 hypothetical protein EAV90_13750 [Bradyrhizobium vignae]
MYRVDGNKMIIDLPNATQAPQRPEDLNAQSSSLADPSVDQANFERQLNDVRPVLQTWDSTAPLNCSEVGSPSTLTKGNVRARAIQERERCPALSFVAGRAELAVSLAGANVETLKNEIRLAARRVARWPATNESSAGGVDGGRILDDVLASSYLRLHRFQDEAIDCKPRLDEDVSAIEHVRSLADFRCHARPHVSKSGICSDDETEDEIDMARLGAWHTQGLTDSAFVSLSQEPSRLLLSNDHSEHGAQAIAKNAKELHTYTVPSVTAWTTEKIRGILERGRAPGDKELLDWVRGIPSQETEVLFLGGNLGDYQTTSEPNPYRVDPPQNVRPIKKARASSERDMIAASRTR